MEGSPVQGPSPASADNKLLLTSMMKDYLIRQRRSSRVPLLWMLQACTNGYSGFRNVLSAMLTPPRWWRCRSQVQRRDTWPCVLCSSSFKEVLALALLETRAFLPNTTTCCSVCSGQCSRRMLFVCSFSAPSLPLPLWRRWKPSVFLQALPRDLDAIEESWLRKPFSKLVFFPLFKAITV